jgi:DNA processing protein
VPGSIHSPLSKGCHALIKQGAKLVESAADVLAELTAFRAASGATPEAWPAAQAEPQLLVHMGFDAADVDTLCTRSGWGAERVSAELLRLELEGRVAALPGGLYQRLN